MSEKKSRYKLGQKIPWKRGGVRIMAYAEGWLMVRYLGAMPILIHESDAQEYENELRMKAVHNEETDEPMEVS